MPLARNQWAAEASVHRGEGRETGRREAGEKTLYPTLLLFASLPQPQLPGLLSFLVVLVLFCGTVHHLFWKRSHCLSLKIQAGSREWYWTRHCFWMPRWWPTTPSASLDS